MFRLFALFSLLTLSSITAVDWWEYGSFYQIYPRSFKDSNGDGIGDLRGITAQLPYLKELGVTGTWLSPIFQSPMYDFGYDISDYMKIHSDYGTLSDFKELIDKCKALGIRLILDLVPNHTSDEHEWFQKSVNGDAEYANFYIWHPGRNNGTNTTVPNNWLNILGGSAWTWNEKRHAYYFHQFSYRQPDLNFRNERVGKKFEEIMDFWLSKGVSGFHINAGSHLFEAKADDEGDLPDEPYSNKCADSKDYCYLDHIYTVHRNETFQLLHQWRNYIDDYKVLNGGETRIMMLEAYAEKSIIQKYYGIGSSNKSAQMPFNFQLLYHFNENTTSRELKMIIDDCLDLPYGYHINWVLGNHDHKRIASRLGPKRIDIFNILLQTLPGNSMTYYGDEIGMTSGFVNWKDTVDHAGCNSNQSVYQKYSRDPARTPFQWDSTISAGFSTAPRTWLPVNSEYKQVNVQLQKNGRKSHLQVFKDLIALRNDVAMTEGRFRSFAPSDDILTYTRQAPGFIPYVIILNIGEANRNMDLKSLYTFLPDRMRVVLASVQSRHNKMDILNTQNIQSEPNTGLILTYP